jgi:hypothetical protein
VKPGVHVGVSCKKLNDGKKRRSLRQLHGCLLPHATGNGCFEFDNLSDLAQPLDGASILL